MNSHRFFFRKHQQCSAGKSFRYDVYAIHVTLKPEIKPGKYQLFQMPIPYQNAQTQRMEASFPNKSTSNPYPAHWIYVILTVAGLSFLFFLGFPFANHNESYFWIVILDKISFLESVTSPLEPVQSFRPLGTAMAWLTYRLTGNIYLQQLVNWLFACASFLVLFRYAKNKMLFSAVAFLATAGFFAGYIYLFHLHGVFYGPLQLYIAVMTGVAYSRSRFSVKELAFLCALTVVATLYHTFALLVFAGFLCGCMLQVPKAMRRAQLPQLFFFLLLSLLLLYLIISMRPAHNDGNLVQGSLTSYATTEVNRVLQFLAFLLATVTVYSLRINPATRHLMAAALVLSAAAFLYFKLPLLLLWIAACLLKTALDRQWTVAALIGATAVFPVATHTGTPTYVVFVIMVCAFVTTTNIGPLKMPRFTNGLALCGIALLLVALVLLKTGVNVPLIAKALNPILAEQEKTHQLESIMAWKKSASAYATYRLQLYDESKTPSASGNAVDRQHRPPTQQRYLTRYYDAVQPTPSAVIRPALQVTFGGKPLNGRQLLYEIKGKWSGSAYVYL
jgi:hypothetical protein